MKSFAARIHEWLGGRTARIGTFNPYEQHGLFDTILSRSTSHITVRHLADHSITIEVVPGTRDEDYRDRFSISLKDLVERIETEQDPDRYEHEDGLTCDYYRQFPRDEASIVVIENSVVGRLEHVLGTDLESAKNTLAKYHGYHSWEDMMSFLPPGVREEDWVARWETYCPAERVAPALKSEAECKALAAIAGEIGIEGPGISRVGWLKTLLDEIDSTPAIKVLLERDDPESIIEMLRECRSLANEGMAALELLMPKFPLKIIERVPPAGTVETSNAGA